jgi:hypothetical protein
VLQSVTGLLQGRYGHVIRVLMLRAYYTGVTRVLKECYSIITIVLTWCYRGVTGVFLRCYYGVDVKRIWYLDGVPACWQEHGKLGTRW